MPCAKFGILNTKYSKFIDSGWCFCDFTANETKRLFNSIHCTTVTTCLSFNGIKLAQNNLKFSKLACLRDYFVLCLVENLTIPQKQNRLHSIFHSILDSLIIQKHNYNYLKTKINQIRAKNAIKTNTITNITNSKNTDQKSKKHK